MYNLPSFEEFVNESTIEELINSDKVYDIPFNGLPSNNGWKLSLQGKSKNDLIDLIRRVHDYLLKENIAHKIATMKRLNHPDKEQSKKLITIYVPDTIDHFKLAGKIERLLKGYTGWHNIKTPTGYEHYSNAIFFRNDRDEYGEYIPAKNIDEQNSVVSNVTTHIKNKILNDNLYHVTTKDNAKNIIKHNYFRVSPGTIGINGLSTTFDKTYNWGTDEVKFVLSFKELNSDYKLVYVDEKLGIDESEIKILSDEAILHAKKYIKNIIYNGNDKNFIDDINEFLTMG